MKKAKRLAIIVCAIVNIFCIFFTIFFNIVKNNNAYLS